jgi:hypothetical protein
VLSTPHGKPLSRAEFIRGFQRVLGLPCWGVHYGYLNLSMNFGKPSLKIAEPKTVLPTRSQRVRELFARRRVTVRGQWWLWLQSCWWKLTAFDETATRTSSNRRIDKVTADLDGQKLTGIEICERTGLTRFTFDLGDILECRRWDMKELAEVWNLYQPNGRVLVVWNDGSLSQA